MKLFGYEIARAVKQSVAPIDDRGGWTRILQTIREPFSGAWQRNIEISRENVLAFSAVYACLSLISQDIGKLRIKLVEQQDDGRWMEIVKNQPAFLPLLRRPCPYLTRIQWLQYWVTSKLAKGNAYQLKARDSRNIVIALYPLEPDRVRPMVAEDGSIWYELNADNLSGIMSRVMVPATEIIHDMMPALFHPLVGISPIYACGLTAAQGLKIQESSVDFFANGARPGGVLSTDKEIKKETADRLREYWDSNFTGTNAGKVAVLGDGLKYEAMAMTAQAAQVIEQLKWTAEVVCSTFHVPPWKIGIGPMPAYGNVESANQDYYSTCLQAHIEAIELALDDGLRLSTGEADRLGTELDLAGLLRMDTKSRFEAHNLAISGGWGKPNEARIAEDRAPVKGGDTPYMQQQNYSLGDLDARSKQDGGAFGTPKPAAAPGAPALPPPAANDDDADPDEGDEADAEELQAAGLRSMLRKALRRIPA